MRKALPFSIDSLKKNTTYIYGPVRSRRLGLSLGVDLVPYKLCSFDCRYCQLGQTTRISIRRRHTVNLKKFAAEFQEALRRTKDIACVTIAGSGEPTLSTDLSAVLALIRRLTKSASPAGRLPVVLITNASLFHRREVRRAASRADIVIPSLDAVSRKIFKAVNRPYPVLKLDSIIRGLIEFRREFAGKIFLEVMLVRGVNDSLKEARRLKQLLPLLDPDKIQLNLPERSVFRKKLMPGSRRVQKYRGVLLESGYPVEITRRVGTRQSFNGK